MNQKATEPEEIWPMVSVIKSRLPTRHKFGILFDVSVRVDVAVSLTVELPIDEVFRQKSTSTVRLTATSTLTLTGPYCDNSCSFFASDIMIGNHGRI